MEPSNQTITIINTDSIKSETYFDEVIAKQKTVITKIEKPRGGKHIPIIVRFDVTKGIE